MEVPTTIRQAFKILDKMITKKERKAFLSQSQFDFTAEQHFGLGMWIRNNWIYGPEYEEGTDERELRDRCYRMLAGGKGDDIIYFEHPDVVSGRFLEKYYKHLKRTAKQ